MHVGDGSGVVQVVDGMVVEEAGVVDGADGVEDVRVTVTVTVADCFNYQFPLQQWGAMMPTRRWCACADNNNCCR